MCIRDRLRVISINSFVTLVFFGRIILLSSFFLIILFLSSWCLIFEFTCSVVLFLGNCFVPTWSSHMGRLICSKSSFSATTSSASLITVSYTHLDVYKRQSIPIFFLNYSLWYSASLLLQVFDNLHLFWMILYNIS